MTQTSDATMRPALWAMLVGNFIIGTGIMLPAGLLNDLMSAFSLTASEAGYLLFVGGVVVGVGAPLLAGLTSQIDRRQLLVAALLVYALGHLASALAPSFTLRVTIRAFTVVGAAVFTPQAATTAGLIVPPEKRAGAIAFIFIGWSAAAVAGIPLGSLLANLTNWRVVYGIMAIMSLLSALSVWLTLKPGLRVMPLSFVSWLSALTSPALICIYLVTMLSMSGQFTMFGYMAPVLKQGFGASAEMVSLSFAIVGVAGVVGNSIASRLVSRLGIARSVNFGLISLCVGFAGFGLFFGNYALAMAVAVFWGLGSFSSNSLQQSRLVGLSPSIAAATVALNTSVVYVGQAIGAALGGRLVDGGAMTWMPSVACGLLVVALLMSFAASRLSNPVDVHQPEKN